MVQHSMILQLYCLQSQTVEPRKLTNLVPSIKSQLQRNKKQNHYQTNKRRNSHNRQPQHLPQRPVANQLEAMMFWPCGRKLLLRAISFVK